MTRSAGAIHRIVVLSAMLGAASLTSAGAQQPSQAQASAVRQSCRSDYQANCAGVPTGGMASLQCLQQHLSRLSPACERAVGATMGVGGGQPPGSSAPGGVANSPPPPPQLPPTNMSPRQEAAMVRERCGMDYRTWCNGVRPSGGRALACLEENGPRLSPGCQTALSAMRAHR